MHRTGRAGNARKPRNEEMHGEGNVTVPILCTELSVFYALAYAMHSKGRTRVRKP